MTRFNVAISETAYELFIQKQVVEVNVPDLNGYKPERVRVTNMEQREYTYDNNTQILTITRQSTVNEETGEIKSLISSIDLIDTSKMTNMAGFFSNCVSISNIPLLDTSSCTYMKNMFYNCSKITSVPLLNTSNVTSMNGMFSNCTNLETIPLMNTTNVTSMNNMFEKCNKLTDTTLDNILQMCINSSVTTNKTLTKIGITSSNYPIEKIQALPHYQDFINAGWTTGY